MTRSKSPSPLKSAAATDTGERFAGKLRAAWKVPFPLPRSTQTEVVPRLATARSWIPSRLKSPTATHCGLLPTT